MNINNKLMDSNCSSTSMRGYEGEPALIEMKDIVKIFRTTAGDFTALKDVNACFYRGEFVSIVGKSGSGKSTLANMLTGIDHPTSGSVRVGDTYVHKLKEGQMAVWRGRNLGIVFQFFQLLPMLSLAENVMLPMDFCNVYEPSERFERAIELLKLVGLEDYAHQLPAAVSGGQQQSAAIARALANDPPVIIADEPTGSLDSKTADSVFAIFKNLVLQGKTIVMVTHDAGLARRTDRVLLISDGELIHEAVTAAFPGLPHSNLLWLNNRLKNRRFEAGQVMIGKDTLEAGLFVVAHGKAQVNLNGSGPISLLPGDYFSELDVQEDIRNFRGIQADSEEPVDVLWADHETFRQWLQDSEAVEVGLQSEAGQGAARWMADHQFDAKGDD